MSQQDEVASTDTGKGLLIFDPAPPNKLELLHAPLCYSWKREREIPTATRTALIEADQLLRRIAQQVLRIDSKGRYQKELSVIYEQTTSAQTAHSSSFFGRVSEWSGNIFLSRSDSRQAVTFLNDAARRTQHYMEYYLVRTNDPENLLSSLESIESQLVSGGLRYRIHALVKSALFLAVTAISIYCLLWMAMQQVVGPMGETIEPSNNAFWSQAVYSFPFIQSFSLLAIGLFSGRFLHIFMSKPEALDTFESYYVIERQLETPVSDLLADNFVALCAAFIFFSGMVVISIGVGSGPEPTPLSTVDINQAEIALALGVLIGLARQQFLGRLRNVAENSLGQNSKSS